jgi:hypothetical protein
MSEALEKILAELDAPVKVPARPERPMRLVADERSAAGRRTSVRNVYVSPNDPNWRGSGSGSVVVRVLEKPEDWDAPCVVSEYHPFTRGLR